MKLAVFALLIMPLVAAASFTEFTQEDMISIGGIYNINAFTNATNDTTPCIAYFKDMYNNTVKSFTSDEGHNAIRIDNTGHVHSYVGIDNSFLTNQSYTFWLSCGEFVGTQQVGMDVAGDWDVNRFVANELAYYWVHPDQAIPGVAIIAVFSIFALSIGAYVYGEVKHL